MKCLDFVVNKASAVRKETDRWMTVARSYARPEERRPVPKWVEYWLIISAVLCTLDVIYTVLRPWTNRGGGLLACLYEPWQWYAEVDLRYAASNDIVTTATGRVMVIEILLNIIAVYLNRTGSPHAVVTAFTTTAFVFWKTLWYMVLYISPPPGNPVFINPKASMLQIIFCFAIPNSIWITVPFLVLVELWDKLLVRPRAIRLPQSFDEDRTTVATSMASYPVPAPLAYGEDSLTTPCDTS